MDKEKKKHLVEYVKQNRPKRLTWQEMADELNKDKSSLYRWVVRNKNLFGGDIDHIL